MGLPLDTTTISTTATTTTTPITTNCTPAAETARLIDEYKQHAAEWAAKEGDSYIDGPGFSSSSRSMMTYKGGKKLFIRTAPLVEGGTEAAFHRYLDACATQKQVEQVQKLNNAHLIQ